MFKMSDYNGWKNWETWNCNLWLDEEGTKEWYREYTKQHHVSVEDLAEMLKNEYWDRYEEQIKTGFFSDVVSNAIRAVDFTQIAEKMLESD